MAASLYAGETGCVFGCLGYGDCVTVCNFDAIHINPETNLPEVDADKCTACGACVKACPKLVIELRKKWPKNRAVYVSCVSKDKGAQVMKACKAGCIACGKCEKVCPHGAITIENNLAYIDPQKCKLCRKCVNECPTGAITLVGMEPLPKAPKAAPAAKKAEAAPAAAAAKAEGRPTIELKATGNNPLVLVNAKKVVMESKAATSVAGAVVELKESGKNPLVLVRGKKA